MRGYGPDDDLLLEPASAYGVAQLAARDAGEALAIPEQVLKKRLHERGLLASVEGKRETLTVRRNIRGSSKQVLHFTRRSLLPEEPDMPDINNEGEGCGGTLSGSLSGFMSGNSGYPTRVSPTE